MVNHSLLSCRCKQKSDGACYTAQDFLLALGTKPGSGGGFLAAKPLFWERPGFVVWTAGAENPAEEEARLAALPEFAAVKAEYDKSRRSVARTSEKPGDEHGVEACTDALLLGGGMCCQSCINGALAFIHADYEVDFAAYFNKLCSLGAKYNPDAYLFPLKVMDMKL